MPEGGGPLRIVVIGAGGLGSYIGAVLDQAGHDVTLVTRGAHREAIERDGLVVRSHAGDVRAHPACVGSAAEVEGADLAFLVTKSFSVDAVAPQVEHLARSGVAIVSLLNGVSTVDRLVALGIPRERLDDGVAYMTSFRIAPGVVERKAAHQRIVAGRFAGLLDEAFAGTIVDVEARDDITVELWEKMAVVCVLSVLCAIGERNMGSIRRQPLGAQLQRMAIAEVFAVGRASGVPVPTDAEQRIDQRLDRFPDDFFPSVIHDLNQGRPTEMSDLGGEIGRLGRETGVATPLHDVGTLIVQLAERRPTP